MGDSTLSLRESVDRPAAVAHRRAGGTGERLVFRAMLEGRAHASTCERLLNVADGEGALPGLSGSLLSTRGGLVTLFRIFSAEGYGLRRGIRGVREDDGDEEY